MASMDAKRATETSVSISLAEGDADSVAARRAEVVEILSTALMTLVLEGPSAHPRTPPKRRPTHAVRIIHVPAADRRDRPRAEQPASQASLPAADAGW